jgi:SAM-dependent methyltransferase
VHKSARDHMALCITTYLRRDRHYDVLDFGSFSGAQRGMTHRRQLQGYNVTYTGVDIRPGPNVDVVMKKPYRLPFRSKSFDLVVTGQTFEHIPFIWTSFLEICRVLRPSGLIFLTAPSRGNPHFFLDPWRFYPDSMRSLAAISRMKLREAHTDLPPLKPGTDRLDYKNIDEERAYWGDTVGVFQKPERYSKLVAVVREVNVWWANRVGGIDHVPAPKALPARSKVSST